MDSSTSSQANQPYSPLNRVTLDMDFKQLMYSQEYYLTQDYSMGQGSAHGSAPVDDDSPVEEMSPVKAKKPSKRASKAMKNDTKEKEPTKEWTTAEEIALCQVWSDVSKNNEKGNGMKAKGFWEAVINYFIKETGSTRGYDSILSKWKIGFALELVVFVPLSIILKRIMKVHCWNILKDHQGWLEVEMPSFYNNTKGRKKSKTSETTSGLAPGGFNLNNEADESEEETQQQRPMGRSKSYVFQNKLEQRTSADVREFPHLQAGRQRINLCSPTKDANPALHAITSRGKGFRKYKGINRTKATSPPPKRTNPAKDAIVPPNVVESWALENGNLFPVYLTELRKKEEAYLRELAPSGATGNLFLVVPQWMAFFDFDMSCSTTNDLVLCMAHTNKRAKINLDSSLLWHCRLGHISKKRIEKLQHDGLLNSIDIESLGKCVSCLSALGSEASGSVEDLEVIQEEDTNPSVDTSLNHEEDDQEIDEPQRLHSNLTGLNYEETFSLLQDIRYLRFSSYARTMDLMRLWQMDVKTAFLIGHTFLKKFLEQPEVFPDNLRNPLSMYCDNTEPIAIAKLVPHQTHMYSRGMQICGITQPKLLDNLRFGVHVMELIMSKMVDLKDYPLDLRCKQVLAPVDDDSPVEEMSPVKAKKPSKRASKAIKNDTKEKEPAKEWTMAEEIALCQVWCDVSKNSEKGSGMKAKGFWEAVINYFIKETGSTRGYDSILSKWKNRVRPRIGCFCAIINNIEENHESDHQGWLEVEMPSFYNNTKGQKKSKTSKTTSGLAPGGFNLNNEADESEEETQQQRPMGRDRSKRKKPSASSHEGSSSFFDLIADKFFNIKSAK
ncbi:ABC transporter G family member 7 isoform X2 [Tanacetum coccineum]